jgi:hypothetical protein
MSWSPLKFVFGSKFISSSSREPRNLDNPLIFSEDYEQLTSWYNLHRKNVSMKIRTMQLRREHDPPFHEFIMIETQSDFIYRVDRGRAGGPVLGAIREGVPAQDTIALLRITSLEQLDRTSYSMIELRWGNDKTIDLRLVLDIGFHIHNTSGNRYKLLTYNCYFFADYHHDHSAKNHSYWS